MGRKSPEIVHEEDLERCIEAYNRAKREGRSFLVARLRVADGTYRWFHMVFSAGELGGVHGLAVSARDITESRALSEALESTRRMEALGRLAGSVAHDFNNILLVVDACADLAATRLLQDHPARKDLADVHMAVERAAAITHQLLTFARGQVLPKAETAVSKTIRDLKPILARMAGPKVVLSVDVDDSKATVDAIPAQLEQLVMNLVSNAGDAMPDGGALSIRVCDRTLSQPDNAGLRPGLYTELEVTDTGAGMSEEVQRHIFEPFYTTKPPGKGTGLGLATVFGLVSQLGGRVTVRSSPGAGSTFTVLIPASGIVPSRELAEPRKILPTTPPARALEVLVVDDEPTVLAAVARMLREAGHRSREAGSTEEALEMAEAQGVHFDAIVTDVVIGSSDGIAMLDRLKTSQPGAGVVVMSGFSPSPERVAKVRERGAEFLAKPFGPTDLLTALARARAQVPLAADAPQSS